MRLKSSAIKTTSAGSARLPIFGLGRAFVRFEEEKDGAGSGGGATGGDGQQSQAASGSGGGDSKERTFTAAEVDGIVRDRLAREKRKAPEPDKKPTSKKAEPSDDPTWVFDLQDAIDAQTEERGVKVPMGLKKRMRSAFAAERPEDPNAWVGTWLDDVGLVKKATDSTTTTEKATADAKTTDTKQTNGKPISDKGNSNVPSKDLDEIANPMDLTQVDIERVYEKHGEDKGNQMITEKVNRWLQSVKVVPDRGGPRR